MDETAQSGAELPVLAVAGTLADTPPSGAAGSVARENGGTGRPDGWQASQPLANVVDKRLGFVARAGR